VSTAAEATLVGTPGQTSVGDAGNGQQEIRSSGYCHRGFSEQIC